MFFAFIKNHNFISGVFLEEVHLRRISRRIMSSGIYLINELEKNPDSKFCSLLRLTQFIKPPVVTAANLIDFSVPLKVLQNLFFGNLGHLQQLGYLKLGQGSILREPFDNVLLILQKHLKTPPCAYLVSE